MNVSFNPAVSFKSDTNLISAKLNEAQKPKTIIIQDSFEKSPEVKSPHSWESEEDRLARIVKENESMKKVLTALEEGKTFDGIIRGSGWEKKYDKASNTVHIKIPNSYDGNEFTVKADGTVIKTSGWSNPEIIMEANQEMADYVKAVKNGKVDEYFAQSDKLANMSKADIFKETLQNHQWKKEYLPESDIIAIKQRKANDGVEYMIEKDGTVKECGANRKAEIIIEPSIDGAKEFGKIKAKLSGENDNVKTSLWYKMKNAVANIWKFFSVTGTMAAATAKGAAEGVVAGAGALVATALLRGAYKVIATDAKFNDVIKHPFKTAGKFGAAMATIAGGAVLAAEVIAGRMRANQNSAVIEHKMDVAHNLD